MKISKPSFEDFETFAKFFANFFHSKLKFCLTSVRPGTTTTFVEHSDSVSAISTRPTAQTSSCLSAG